MTDTELNEAVDALSPCVRDAAKQLLKQPGDYMLIRRLSALPEGVPSIPESDAIAVLGDLPYDRVTRVHSCERYVDVLELHKLDEAVDQAVEQLREKLDDLLFGLSEGCICCTTPTVHVERKAFLITVVASTAVFYGAAGRKLVGEMAALAQQAKEFKEVMERSKGEAHE